MPAITSVKTSGISKPKIASGWYKGSVGAFGTVGQLGGFNTFDVRSGITSQYYVVATERETNDVYVYTKDTNEVYTIINWGGGANDVTGMVVSETHILLASYPSNYVECYTIASLTAGTNTTPPDWTKTFASGDFGQSVELNSSYAFISRPGATTETVYVYNVFTGATVQTITNPNIDATSTNDNFGVEVRATEDYLMVSASLEDTGALSATGAVYLYNTTNWNRDYTFIGKLATDRYTSTNLNDRFLEIHSSIRDKIQIFELANLPASPATLSSADSADYTINLPDAGYVNLGPGSSTFLTASLGINNSSYFSIYDISQFDSTEIYAGHEGSGTHKPSDGYSKNLAKLIYNGDIQAGGRVDFVSSGWGGQITIEEDSDKVTLLQGLGSYSPNGAWETYRYYKRPTKADII